MKSHCPKAYSGDSLGRCGLIVCVPRDKGKIPCGFGTPDGSRWAGPIQYPAPPVFPAEEGEK